MAKDRSTATKIHGDKVTIELEDWVRILAAFKLETLRGRGELQGSAAARGAGGCGDACGRHGGCDFEAGEPPERVYVCQDGHVILELEV